VTPSQQATSVETVTLALCTYLAGKSRTRRSPEQFDPGANVWLAGYVDSLAYVEFLVFIEEQYGVLISDVDLAGDLNTLGAVAAFVCESSRPGRK